MVGPGCAGVSSPCARCCPSTASRSARRPTTSGSPRRRRAGSCATPSWSEIITAQREDKTTGRFVQTLGSRKMWIRLRGQGHDVARCTVERIMREQGWEGARYGSKHRTTIADAEPRPLPGSGRPRLQRAGAEPALGRRLHLRADLDRVRLRRVRHRRVLPPDRRLAGGPVDDHRRWSSTLSSTRSSPAPSEGVTDLSGLISHSDAGSVNTPRWR